VENPINVLARMITGLHDAQHAVAIPGFYEDVRPLTDDERANYRALPFDKEEWQASIGVEAVRSEEGYSILEATTARPTLDVNGIWGGYQGEGAKTVLPSKAGAKISMRLVPDQRPENVVEKLRRYLEAHVPDTVKLEFRNLHGGHPSITPLDSPAMQAASQAMQEVYGREPLFTREGGSIPVVADFKRILGIDTVLLGFGLNSDSIHSPNEHFGLNRFRQGIECIIRFLPAYREQMASVETANKS
jgi:acetylornithine deacetylase/succinyl-diaminopimelate desuccinylase-like protein